MHICLSQLFKGLFKNKVNANILKSKANWYICERLSNRLNRMFHLQWIQDWEIKTYTPQNIRISDEKFEENLAYVYQINFF